MIFKQLFEAVRELKTREILTREILSSVIAAVTVAAVAVSVASLLAAGLGSSGGSEEQSLEARLDTLAQSLDEASKSITLIEDDIAAREERVKELQRQAEVSEAIAAHSDDEIAAISEVFRSGSSAGFFGSVLGLLIFNGGVALVSGGIFFALGLYIQNKRST